MDLDRLAISRIIASKDLGSFSEAGITGKFFLNPKDRSVFDTIVEFNSSHGDIPTVNVLQMDFPEYKLVNVKEPTSWLIEQLQKKHALSLLEGGIADAMTAYDDQDPKTAVSVLLEAIQEISTDLPSGRDIDLTVTGIDRMKRYRELAANPEKLLGAPTGFPTIDRATQGLQKEHLVTIVGPPKAGKSAIMLLAAMAAWVQDYVPLFFTFEMSNDEMAERFDAFKAEISAKRLREGNLKPDEWLRLDKMLKQIEAMEPFWFSADSSGASTISGISAKVASIEPDLLFVDGIYLMTDEISGESNSPTALTNLTRGFKKLAQNKEICVVISTQVLLWKMDKKKGVTADSIGYSSSFGQDSNTVLAVQKTEDDAIQLLKVLLSRNCPPTEVFIEWNWDRGSFKELLGDPYAESVEDGWDATKQEFC